mmetsp:Transcript_1338/g.1809  ORF Transcript_1338/g.1809 Transcript_1338/m.1809 type:complete len:129 (-) Transcript_1338:1674-2060(-)
MGGGISSVVRSSRSVSIKVLSESAESLNDQVAIDTEDDIINEDGNYVAQIVFLSDNEATTFEEGNFKEDDAVWQLVTIIFHGNQFRAVPGDTTENENIENNESLFQFNIADIKSLHVNLPQNTSVCYA